MKTSQNHGNSNKIILFIGVIILMIGAYFYNAYTYQNVHIKSDQSDYDYLNANGGDIQALSQAFKSGVLSNDGPSGSPLYTLDLTHPIYGQDTYDILSISEEGVYFTFEDETYMASQPDFFYTSPWFQGIYSDLYIADTNLSIHDHVSGNVESLTNLNPSNVDWYYEKFDGTWHAFEAPIYPDTQPLSFDLPNSDLVVYFDKEPTTVSVNYELEGNDTLLISDVTYDYDGYHLPTPDRDGIYTYHLTAVWDDTGVGYRGSLKYQFTVSYIRPTLYTFVDTDLEQGQPLIIHAQYLDEGYQPTITQNLTDKALNGFISDGAVDTMILPTNYTTSPGQYEVTIDGQTTTLNISKRAFNVQHLIIDESVATSTRNDAAYIEFDEKFDPSREVSSSEIMSEGAFILPVNGRLSTEFGETRDVNGSPTTYRHSGWDIAAPQGTPVKATNNGIVVFSEPLILTGNTVVIDHGGGIFSIYFHMHTLSKTAGDYVTKGDEIGTVGTTGFSTGPHLHFIISWYDQNLEPGWFVYGQSITYDNYKDFFK